MKRNEVIEKIFLARGEDLYLGEGDEKLLKEGREASEAFMKEIKNSEKLKNLYYNMHIAECGVWAEECDRLFCEGVRWGVKLMLDLLNEKV